mgnify:FL=1
MQVLSSSQKKDITPSQLLPESMFDFIYAEDGEAVIKSGIRILFCRAVKCL